MQIENQEKSQSMVDYTILEYRANYEQKISKTTVNENH